MCWVFVNPGFRRIGQRAIVELRIQDNAKSTRPHQVGTAHNDSAIGDHRLFDVIGRVDIPVVIQPQVEVTPPTLIDRPFINLGARVDLVAVRVHVREGDGVVFDSGIQTERTP